MDFSQLPKMSKTPPVPANADGVPAEAAEAAVDDHPPVAQEAVATSPRSARHVPAYQHYDASPFGLSAVWISLICGLLCLMFGMNFIRWAGATLSGQTFNTNVTWNVGERAGQPVSYFELTGGTAWTETGLFLMGIALLLDAGLMLIAYRGGVPNRRLVMLAVVITGAAMLLNIAVAFYVFGMGILPFTSIIALLVGGMILFDHVPLLKRRA